MLAYYARPISIDGTFQAKRDIALIEAMGYEPRYVGTDITFPFMVDYATEGMHGFKSHVESCQLLIFRALPDNSIPAGVAKEIQWALDAGIPVVEIPRQIMRRTLNAEDTRDMLAELGQR